MKIRPAYVTLLFISALYFVAASSAAGESVIRRGQDDKSTVQQQPPPSPPTLHEQTPAKSEETGAAVAAPGIGGGGGGGGGNNGNETENPAPHRRPEDKGVLTRAVKRNFATREGVNLTEKDKQSVAMNAEDAERYAAFLEGKDTGFVRLYDVADCELDRRILKVGDDCPANMRGRGTSYSFRQKKYQTGWFSDLKIQNGALQVTGLNVLGMLTSLGDLPLENLTLENIAVSTMAGFYPPDRFEAAREQAQASARGFKLNEFFYRSILPVKEHNTYALRAIAFRGEVIQRVGIFRRNVLDGDKREDVIIVFRIIRRHPNGSVSLLWRELQRTRAPKLILPKEKGKK